MEVIAAIFLAHLVGDYIIQTDWMATEKTKRWWPAVVHGVTYTLPFILITQSIPALLVICATHIVIDRYRLAKHFIWAKNQLAPKSHRPTYRSENSFTGFNPQTPTWLAFWLMIIVDNTIHILINLAAVLWL